MNLPIIITEPQEIEQKWKTIYSILFKLSLREKDLEIKASDRVACKALGMANHYAARREWHSLFTFLLDRDIVKVRELEPSQPSEIKQRETKPTVKREPISKSPKFKDETIIQKLRDLAPLIFNSDYAISVDTAHAKLAENGLIFTERICRDYLSTLSKEGLICKTSQSSQKLALYALQETKEIGKDEWLLSAIAYKIAQSNGFPHTLKAFIAFPFRGYTDEKVALIYARWGIEYRFDHKHLEPCKWRQLRANNG
jgi:hypothetical protein